MNQFADLPVTILKEVTDMKNTIMWWEQRPVSPTNLSPFKMTQINNPSCFFFFKQEEIKELTTSYLREIRVLIQNCTSVSKIFFMG